MGRLILAMVLTAGRAALGATAGITATPAALQFSYQTGAAALPAPQTLQVQSSPAGLSFTAVVSGAPFNAAWLLLSATTGATPASLKVQVNPTGLAAGAYAGTIAFTAVSGSQTYNQSITVTLLVSAAAPTVTASPTALSFTYVTGDPVPSASLASNFLLSSSGAALSATVSVTGAAWLKVTPTGSVSLIGLFNTFSVTVNPAGLAPKAYTGTITISTPNATNKTTTIGVTLTVNAAVPVVTGLWPAGVIQGASATVVTVEGSSYYPSSTVSATGFAPEATVTATDGTNSTTETFVIPTYRPAATGLRVNAASPLPSGVTGTAYLQPLSAGGGTGPYTYSFLTGMLPPGLAVLGTTISGTPTAAGAYFFSVQVTDSSVPPVSAYTLLKLTVSPAASATIRITSAAAPLSLGTVGTAYGPATLTAAGGTGGPYTWSATNLPPGMSLSNAGVLGGTPSTDGSTGALTGVVVSDAAILATIPATGLTAAGVLRVAVNTPTPGGGPSNEGQFQIYGPGPQITAVTNSASFAQGSIAPGEVLAIFGLGVGPSQLTIFDPSSPPIPTALPTSSPSTTVTINGTPAPILYTSASQIGVIVPNALTGTSAQVVVSYGGMTSQAFTVAIAAADPGVFSLASSGQGQGAILNYAAGNYTINSSTNPALRGSIAVIYMTGGGTTTLLADDQLIPASPAVTPVLPPSVTIGGVAATVLAAQSPVGSVPGLIQLNVTVPTGATAGAASPVVVTVGGIMSQTGLTMAVK